MCSFVLCKNVIILILIFGWALFLPISIVQLVLCFSFNSLLLLLKLSCLSCSFWAGGRASLFHSILFMVATKMEKLDPHPPPPPPQKKREKTNIKNLKMVHFSLLAGFSPSWFCCGNWGSFTCFKIVDQTLKLQPSVSNISNVCFCLLKEHVTNLQKSLRNF